MEQIANNSSGTVDFSREDIKTLESLSIEFADELVMLGIRYSNLDADFKMVKEDISNIKKDIDSIKSVGNSNLTENKLKITGDVIVRHEDQLKGGPNNVKGQVTTSALRLQFDLKIDENISASIQPMIYADDLGTNLGGAAGNTMSYYRSPARNRQNDIYNAHLDFKNVLNGKIVLGRSFYTHGSALVMNGYVDAIRYFVKSGQVNVALNAIYRNVLDDTFTKFRYDKQIWNINLDSKVNGHNLYLGYYTQDYDYETSAKRSIIELGSKGKISKDNKITYDFGFVNSNVDDYLGGDDKNGNLYHIAIKYDDGKDWAFKLSYSAGDDEYISTNQNTLSGGRWLYARNDMKTFGGPETPFDDFLYLRPNMSLQDATFFKIQTEFKPKTSKHYFRIAYDMYNQDKNNKGVAEDDAADVLTLEYKYQLAKNTRLRIGYYSLEGDKKSDGVEDDALYIELYSRF